MDGSAGGRPSRWCAPRSRGGNIWRQPPFRPKSHRYVQDKGSLTTAACPNHGDYPSTVIFSHGVTIVWVRESRRFLAERDSEGTTLPPPHAAVRSPASPRGKMHVTVVPRPTAQRRLTWTRSRAFLDRRSVRLMSKRVPH